MMDEERNSDLIGTKDGPAPDEAFDNAKADKVMMEGTIQIQVDHKVMLDTVFRGSVEDLKKSVREAGKYLYKMFRGMDEYRANVNVKSELGTVVSVQMHGEVGGFLKKLSNTSRKVGRIFRDEIEFPDDSKGE